jgi:hypothetical protein
MTFNISQVLDQYTIIGMTQVFAAQTDYLFSLVILLVLYIIAFVSFRNPQYDIKSTLLATSVTMIWIVMFFRVLLWINDPIFAGFVAITIVCILFSLWREN